MRFKFSFSREFNERCKKSSEEKRIDEELGFGNTLLNHDGRFLVCDATEAFTTQAVIRNVQ